MSQYRLLALQELQNSRPLTGCLPSVENSMSGEWLPAMIFTAKTMAAVAECVPVPCIQGVFNAVVTFLESVDRIQRNRQDLKDLCASTLEIATLLHNELTAHGERRYIQHTALLEDFVSFLAFLQDRLEILSRKKRGFRSRLKIFNASRIAEEISRYRMRANDFRGNFLLLTALNTSVNVMAIQETLTGLHSVPDKTQFRHIALGDINLLHEVIRGEANKIKIYAAQVFGEPSTMTVALYEDCADKWQHDLDAYSSCRHPNVWQLFGISTTPILRALIFYDEPIPLPIYRKFHRPQSDFVWTCVETMLFKQFKECAQYHRESTSRGCYTIDATICVKRKPISICLTMVDSDSKWDFDRREFTLSLWHSPLFRHRAAPASDEGIARMLTYEAPLKQMFEHLSWDQFLSLPTPAWLPTLSLRQPMDLYLGSVIRHGGPSNQRNSIAYIPSYSSILLKNWTFGPPSRSSRGHRWKPEQDSHRQQ
ncbi:hypothetical protein MSAN_02295600 [Mycena sanguinolenta]|uniref:Uncharacterized protein n=1 Tax=Mycena sanguinolenta TaxID=230812 RepID=A0A8H7CHE1_9AGAR|nr:hypothetical protein MSAN_02295600 [Mycena sanguinolenta]